MDNIVAEGYPASQIINQVFIYFPLLSMVHLNVAVVVNNHFFIQLSSQLFDIVVKAGDDITDTQKANICKCLAETDKVRLPLLLDSFFVTSDFSMELVGDSCEIDFQHPRSIESSLRL